MASRHPSEEGFGMRRSRLVVAAAVVGVAGFTAAATAGDRKSEFATDMPATRRCRPSRPPATARSTSKVARDGQSLQFELHYRALESHGDAVAHPLRAEGRQRRHRRLLLLATWATARPARLRARSPRRARRPTVTGTRTAADMVGAGRPGHRPGRVRRARARPARGRGLRQRPQRGPARRRDPRPVRPSRATGRLSDRPSGTTPGSGCFDRRWNPAHRSRASTSTARIASSACARSSA